MFRIERWAVPALVAAFALSAFFVWAASKGYPTSGGVDALCYLTPAMNDERGLGLMSRVCRYMAACDPSGGGRLLAYPPGFQAVLTALMPTPSLLSALVAIQLIHSATVLLGTLAAVRGIAAGASSAPAVLKAGLAMMATFALASGFSGMGVGRPEVLVQAILALALVLLPEGTARTLPLRAGLFIGLAGAVSPWAAVLGGMFFVWWRSLTEERIAALIRQSVLAGLVSGITWGLASLMFPYSMREFVDAMSCVKQAFGGMVRFDGESSPFNVRYFLFFQIGYTAHPLVLGWTSLELLALVPVLRSPSPSSLLRAFLRLMFATAVLIGVFKYQFYIVAPWFPLAVVFLAGRAASSVGSGNSRLDLGGTQVAGLARVLLLAIAGSGLWLSLAGWPGYAASIGRAGAESAVERLLEHLPETSIGMERTFLLFPTESERVRLVRRQDRQLQYEASNGEIRVADGTEPPVILLRGACLDVQFSRFRTVCLPWREPGPALHRWVDHERFGWAFTLLVRDDAGLDVDALVNEMMCAAGDAAKPGSCRPR